MRERPPRGHAPSAWSPRRGGGASTATWRARRSRRRGRCARRPAPASVGSQPTKPAGALPRRARDRSAPSGSAHDDHESATRDRACAAGFALLTLSTKAVGERLTAPVEAHDPAPAEPVTSIAGRCSARSWREFGSVNTERVAAANGAPLPRQRLSSLRRLRERTVRAQRCGCVRGAGRRRCGRRHPPEGLDGRGVGAAG